MFDALQSIARQARALKLDNADEIVTMCRKRYGEKVGKYFSCGINGKEQVKKCNIKYIINIGQDWEVMI